VAVFVIDELLAVHPGRSRRMVDPFEIFAGHGDPKTAEPGLKHAWSRTSNHDLLAPHRFHVSVQQFGRERPGQTEFGHHHVRPFLA
jgi:hypothetical protein